MKKLGLAMGLALLALVGTCVVFVARATPEKSRLDARNRAGAERIVAALESFRADAGVYPAHLGELVPATLAGLPRQSRWADGGEPSDFSYEPAADRKRFELGYQEVPLGSFAGGGYRYDSANREWTLIPD